MKFEVSDGPYRMINDVEADRRHYGNEYGNVSEGSDGQALVIEVNGFFFPGYESRGHFVIESKAFETQDFEVAVARADAFALECCGPLVEYT